MHWILNRRPDIDEVRVMGDSANDAGMIREFHGAAPVWASAEVRQTAAGVLNDAAELLKIHVHQQYVLSLGKINYPFLPK